MLLLELPWDSLVSLDRLCLRRRHPSAGGWGQGSQPAGERREQSCGGASSSLMLFMVMNSRGLLRRRRRRGVRGGEEIGRGK